MRYRTSGRTYYDILGVSPSVSTPEIKQAYRALAMQWHPDRHQGDSAKRAAHLRFMEINESYAVLSDPALRLQYDQTLTQVHSHTGDAASSTSDPINEAAERGRQASEKFAAMTFEEFQGALSSVLEAGASLVAIALYGGYRAAVGVGNLAKEMFRPETPEEYGRRIEREREAELQRRAEEIRRKLEAEHSEAVRVRTWDRNSPLHKQYWWATKRSSFGCLGVTLLVVGGTWLIFRSATRDIHHTPATTPASTPGNPLCIGIIGILVFAAIMSAFTRMDEQISDIKKKIWRQYKDAGIADPDSEVCFARDQARLAEERNAAVIPIIVLILSTLTIAVLGGHFVLKWLMRAQVLDLRATAPVDDGRYWTIVAAILGIELLGVLGIVVFRSGRSSRRSTPTPK